MNTLSWKYNFFIVKLLYALKFVIKCLFQSLPRSKSHQLRHLVHLQFADRSDHADTHLDLAAHFISGMQVRIKERLFWFWFDFVKLAELRRCYLFTVSERLALSARNAKPGVKSSLRNASMRSTRNSAPLGTL